MLQVKVWSVGNTYSDPRLYRPQLSSEGRLAFGFPYSAALSRVAQIRILLSHRFTRRPWRFNPTKRYCVRLPSLFSLLSCGRYKLPPCIRSLVMP